MLHNIENAAIQYRNMRLVSVKALNSYGKYNGGWWWTKKNGGKIISVGTTSTRTLETIGDENGMVRAQSGWTNIFIYPGYEFKVVDKLITNFHLPESTLIMLVSALAGKEKVMNAYNEAVKERYRFFSFGDSMIIK